MDTSNLVYLDNRLQLESVNSGNGKKFERIPTVVRSTVFWDPESVIGEQTFFGSALNEQWQTKEFPNNVNAFYFESIRISDNLQFLVTSALQTPQALKSFVEGSKLVISNNGNEVATLPLDRLVQWKTIAANNITGVAAAYITIEPNFNNDFFLDTPIIINAGEQPTFRLVPATGFETAAWTAACGPFLTNTNGSGLANASQGFYIGLELKGMKIKPNKG